MKPSFLLWTAIAVGISATTQSAISAEPTDDQLSAAFKAADSDADGTVKWSEAKRFGLRKKTFQAADANKDGSLDRTEFTAALKAQFNAADPDRDKTLDAKEAPRAGIRKKDFASADPDKDATLDFSEYVKQLTAKAQSMKR